MKRLETLILHTITQTNDTVPLSNIVIAQKDIVTLTANVPLNPD